MDLTSIRAFHDELLKIAALGAQTTLPAPTMGAAITGAFHAIPKASKVPSISNINPWELKHMPQGATPATMTAATVPPGRLAQKTAAELTPEARDDLPGKDFAVKAKKSNTGKEAYPIPDRQHARSALGFAKMHGDSADLSAVRAKIKAKYPDMLKAAGSSTVKLSSSFDRKAALEALVGEAGPALGATLGAGVAGGLGKNPLSGAAMGYGVGSIPELLLHRHKAPTHAKTT